MSIRFGPAGIGPVKNVEKTFEEYSKLGIKAAEIPFTYGVFIKEKRVAEKVKKAAEKFNIKLSVHAPYWINLNSKEPIKIEQSKQRILKCLEIGTYLNATKIVFHAGFYSKMSKEETYQNIKREIQDLQKIRKENKYTPKLAPEIMGKINVFGSIKEINRLVKETNCIFCIDFAHVLARYKSYKFKEVFKEFHKHKNLHIHFSGIDYGEKGEKNHKRTPVKEIIKLLENLPKNKNITIISESPKPLDDTVLTVQTYRNIKSKA